MKILSIAEVDPWLKRRPGFWDVISIGDEMPLTKLCRRHCELDCDDVLTARSDPPVFGEITRRVPLAGHVRQALEFVRETEDERLIVHCHAGVSRSPAIAWCILLDRSRSVETATKLLFELQPQALPNRTIICHGLELLAGSSAALNSVMAEMRRRSRHPRKGLGSLL
jgi:predicted protein tyrosine phosphatase